MKAIILAAGRGNRLIPVSKTDPKCLVKVGNRSLLHHQLYSLRENGIRDIVIVVGYQDEAVRAHAKEVENLNITFIYNPEYALTNTAYSLWLCRDHMREDFIYLNGDVLFHPELLERVIDSPHYNVLALDNKPCGAEEVKTIILDDTILHIGKKLDQKKAYGEFIGVAKFNEETNTKFVEYLSNTVNKEMLANEYFEYALNMLIKEEPFHYVDVSDIPCIEIDFPEDYNQAQNEIFPAIQRFSLR